jgi:diguanylate cyclase (GGDEF)-like protein
MTWLLGALALAVGVSIGLRWPRASSGAAAPSDDAATVRTAATPATTTPILGEQAVAFDDDRFGGLLRDALADVVRQHGAAAAVLWRSERGVLQRERLVGDATQVIDDTAGIGALTSWSMSEGLAQLGPDGDAPRVVVAPLALPGEEATGALGLFFAEPISGDRVALKQWMVRHGARLRLLNELLSARHELARTNRRIRTILRDVQQWDAASADEGLGSLYCELIERVLNVHGAALVRWDEARQSGVVVAAHGDCERYLDHPVEDDSLVADACRENVPGIWHDVLGRGEGPSAVIAPSIAPERGCVLIHPLRRRTEVIGAIVAVHREPGALTPADLRTLSLVDAAATSRLVATWRIAEVNQRAMIDGLTNLTNRRGFEAAMDIAREEAERHRWEVSLIITDVDHFKAVNDTHGHEAGDKVLRHIAQVLNDRVRELDVCARVGGEEIAILLKNTGPQGADELAERLRIAIESAHIVAGGTVIPVTASFGVATFPTNVTEWSGLYGSADQALYAAKHGGRNQVRHFGVDEA